MSCFLNFLATPLTPQWAREPQRSRVRDGRGPLGPPFFSKKGPSLLLRFHCSFFTSFYTTLLIKNDPKFFPFSSPVPSFFPSCCSPCFLTHFRHKFIRQTFLVDHPEPGFSLKSSGAYSMNSMSPFLVDIPFTEYVRPLLHQKSCRNVFCQ